MRITGRLGLWRELIAQNARDGHGLERGAHNVGGTRSVRIVRSLGLQQLRVRENDAQLIVQAMKECPQVANIWGFKAIPNHFHARPPTSGPKIAGRRVAATANR